MAKPANRDAESKPTPEVPVSVQTVGYMEHLFEFILDRCKRSKDVELGKVAAVLGDKVVLRGTDFGPEKSTGYFDDGLDQGRVPTKLPGRFARNKKTGQLMLYVVRRSPRARDIVISIADSMARAAAEELAPEEKRTSFAMDILFRLGIRLIELEPKIEVQKHPETGEDQQVVTGHAAIVTTKAPKATTSEATKTAAETAKSCRSTSIRYCVAQESSPLMQNASASPSSDASGE